jgi:hypothetical protein
LENFMITYAQSVSIIGRIFLVVLAAIVQTSCATDKAAKVRADRPVSVGLLGVGVRPAPGIGVMVHGSFSDDGGGGYSSVNDKTERRLSYAGHRISGEVQYFLWDTSAFHIGAGLEAGSGKVAFDAKQSNSDALTRVKYARESRSIYAPIGWFWIWESGASLGLNFGPSWRFYSRQSLVNDGGANVDVNDRDKVINHSPSFNVIQGGQVFIGYSF